MPPCCSAGGIFSVALSVTEPHRAPTMSERYTPKRVTPLCSGACVAVPWRYQARCPLPRAAREGGEGSPQDRSPEVFVTGSCEPTTTVSGLSSRPDCSGPAITRPVRTFHYNSIVASGELAGKGTVRVVSNSRQISLSSLTSQLEGTEPENWNLPTQHTRI